NATYSHTAPPGSPPSSIAISVANQPPAWARNVAPTIQEPTRAAAMLNSTTAVDVGCRGCGCAPYGGNWPGYRYGPGGGYAYGPGGGYGPGCGYGLPGGYWAPGGDWGPGGDGRLGGYGRRGGCGDGAAGGGCQHGRA